MALAMIDKNKKELQFAGAYNPLYIVRNKKLLQENHLEQYYSLENEDHRLFELKGDRQSIAIHQIETDFETKKVPLQKGDSIYLFSDGFVDQKGGPNHKKFLSKNFKKLLLGIQSYSMEAQRKQLDDSLEAWQEGYEQIDDILVVGIRV